MLCLPGGSAGDVGPGLLEEVGWGGGAKGQRQGRGRLLRLRLNEKKIIQKNRDSKNPYFKQKPEVFMYRRPILCTLYGAVDFLNVLKKGFWWGLGDVLLVKYIIYYVGTCR